MRADCAEVVGPMILLCIQKIPGCQLKAQAQKSSSVLTTVSKHSLTWQCWKKMRNFELQMGSILFYLSPGVINMQILLQKCLSLY